MHRKLGQPIRPDSRQSGRIGLDTGAAINLAKLAGKSLSDSSTSTVDGRATLTGEYCWKKPHLARTLGLLSRKPSNMLSFLNKLHKHTNLARHLAAPPKNSNDVEGSRGEELCGCLTRTGTLQRRRRCKICPNRTKTSAGKQGVHAFCSCTTSTGGLQRKDRCKVALTCMPQQALQSSEQQPQAPPAKTVCRRLELGSGCEALAARIDPNELAGANDDFSSPAADCAMPPTCCSSAPSPAEGGPLETALQNGTPAPAGAECGPDNVACAQTEVPLAARPLETALQNGTPAPAAFADGSAPLEVRAAKPVSRRLQLVSGCEASAARIKLNEVGGAHDGSLSPAADCAILLTCSVTPSTSVRKRQASTDTPMSLDVRCRVKRLCKETLPDEAQRQAAIRKQARTPHMNVVPSKDVQAAAQENLPNRHTLHRAEDAQQQKKGSILSPCSEQKKQDMRLACASRTKKEEEKRKEKRARELDKDTTRKKLEQNARTDAFRWDKRFRGDSRPTFNKNGGGFWNTKNMPWSIQNHDASVNCLGHDRPAGIRDRAKLNVNLAQQTCVQKQQASTDTAMSLDVRCLVKRLCKEKFPDEAQGQENKNLQKVYNRMRSTLNSMFYNVDVAAISENDLRDEVHGLIATFVKGIERGAASRAAAPIVVDGCTELGGRLPPSLPINAGRPRATPHTVRVRKIETHFRCPKGIPEWWHHPERDHWHYYGQDQRASTTLAVPANVRS